MKKILWVLLFLMTGAYLVAEKIYLQKADIEFGDGDTFTANGVVIRVLGVDTPEIFNPDHGIMVNQYLGPEASFFTKHLIEQARSLYYIPHKNDIYSRLLAHVFVDDELLAVKLIKAGLGYETVSIYGDNGYPKLASKVSDSAALVGRPNFTNPLYWRRKNIKRK
ncbi:MAG: thermonuclease family protein [bacterium]|nr:thermonuclease family protein [bacterium]